MIFSRRAKTLFYLPVAIALLAICAAPRAKAADPAASLKLTSDTTRVGEPVELTLEVTGAQNGEIPRDMKVDGLNIQFENQSTSVSISTNSPMVRTNLIIYQVTPAREGKFTIPALTLELDGKKVTTNSVTLTASAAGAASQGTAGNNPPADNKPQAFGELVTPRLTAYVGEVIPVELRFYLDERIRVLQGGLGDVKADGFNILKMKQDEQRTDERNDRRYAVHTFSTAVIPQKSGQLSIAPVQLQLVAQIPDTTRRRQNQMPGSMDDFFNDNMFPSPFGGFNTQRATVSTDETKFEIKPLPKTGQPGNFSGAVGQFTMNTEASPLKLKAGDPITVKFKITGRGNFDRVTAPAMPAETGWNTYPPSGKFTEDDELGISGTKVFEMALIPTEPKNELPVFEFSYFDPVAGKYVTLKSDRLPIVVEGATTTAAQPATNAAPAEPAKASSDIHYIFTGPAHWDVSFAPLFRQRIFWESQAAPMLGFLAFVGFRLKQRKAGDLRARQVAMWRREQGDLMKILHAADADPAAFYDAAVRYIQLVVARNSGLNPGSVGPADAAASRPLDDETREGVQSIFNTHGELRYAGVGATRQKLPDARRNEVLETLGRFENAKA